MKIKVRTTGTHIVNLAPYARGSQIELARTSVCDQNHVVVECL